MTHDGLGGNHASHDGLGENAYIFWCVYFCTPVGHSSVAIRGIEGHSLAHKAFQRETHSHYDPSCSKLQQDVRRKSIVLLVSLIADII
jgi:hypothetical protein